MSSTLKAVRSYQPSRGEQQQSLRRYQSAGSSPIVRAPNLSSLSPLYPLPRSPTSAGSSPGSTRLDDAIGRLFTRYIPTFFDMLEKFQFQKALLIVEDEEETQWKSWHAAKVMLKLGASCESTYHAMKYLETDLVQTNTIEQMYKKLVVLIKHLMAELRPIAARQSRHNFVDMSDIHENTNASRSNVVHERNLQATMALSMCGDMNYYVDLLEQGAEFFSLRAPMIQIYRGLALSTVPRDYHSILKQLEAIIFRLEIFDHPLLEVMKFSAIEELRTVHAAIQCEIRVAEYDYTRSIVALHRLKGQLRSWSDHIDASSDYPLFDGNSFEHAGDNGEERMLLDDSDDNNGVTSDSQYSNLSYQSSSSVSRNCVIPASLIGESRCVSTGTLRGISSSQAESLVLFRGGRYATMSDNSYEFVDEGTLLEGHHSGVSLNNSFSPASSETHSTLRRLFSHSNLLRRGSVSASTRRRLVQKAGGPYIDTGGMNLSMPNNTLEQGVLGGGASGTGGGSGTSLGTPGALNNGGIDNGSTNLFATEIMASSIKRQERDDGFALPVFQWSKRFYRSLVAKFTLYFYRWLEPLEKKSDYLTLELSRFIKTPLGISYFELMNVLLSRAQRGDWGKVCVMLILETQALENKGAHYYKSGYRCPSSSYALSTRTNQGKGKKKEEKQEESASDDTDNAAGVQSHTQSPASSRGGSGSPANEQNRSIDQEANHALFMRVDREENEELNDYSELWGLRSWPAVFCYPEGSSLPLDHWPNIVSLIMDHRSTLGSVHPVFRHSERRQKATYHISRVDEAMYLVLLAEEGKKKFEKLVQDFMQTVTENLQHSGAFVPRSLASSSPCAA